MNIVFSPFGTGYRSWSVSLTIFFAFIFVVLMGAILALGSFMLSGVAFAIAAVILLLASANAFQWRCHHIILTGLLILFFALPALFKVTGVGLQGYLQALILGLGTFGLIRLVDLVGKSRLFIVSSCFFVAFLMLAVASSIHSGRSGTQAALYQFASDLKLPLTFAFGLYICSKIDAKKVLDLNASMLLPICILLVAMEWASPGTYKIIFKTASISADPSGTLPSRASALFEHSSMLAAMASFFSIYYFSQAVVLNKRKIPSRIKFLGFFALLIASMQRQEIFALIVVLGIIFLLSSSKRMMFRASVALLIGCLLVFGFLLVFNDVFLWEAKEWGFGTFQSIKHPRAQLYEGAYHLAQTYFPLGSGLGTYGGAGAQKFDLSAYYELGFSRHWWFLKEDFLMDTYWPNSLAEAGILGCAFLLIHYLLLAAYLFYEAVKATSKEQKAIWLATAAAFLWVLFVSLTSPGFQEIRLLFLPALMLGIAVASKTKKSPGSNEAN